MIARRLLRLAGVLCLLIGLLWVLQGLGILDWPAQSFMIAQRQWSVRGALLMIAGIALLIVSRKMGRSDTA
ncbi:hypothetical protein [Stakelama pacifica]|uniref:Uncharacterized protein n=1 Tax=Stakelama pacifica TaxID=517720 RepID=A0A4R6FXL0_9SPHN|nr:hypothetical protein [Stakelama pacifica]TDN86527.1 hypothetical protein EV664_10198 [Stakelama pacifica]GGO89915.1 hypothetical protein GCM10011329_01000 [Stakelama pacifica]